MLDISLCNSVLLIKFCSHYFSFPLSVSLALITFITRALQIKILALRLAALFKSTQQSRAFSLPVSSGFLQAEGAAQGSQPIGGAVCQGLDQSGELSAGGGGAGWSVPRLGPNAARPERHPALSAPLEAA